MQALACFKRSWLGWACIALATWCALLTAHAQGQVQYPAVIPGKPLVFPRDFGAHPDYRTEWWYATGWLNTPDQKPLGFQITFFRSRTTHSPDNPSRFAPHQLIIAHAALSDPATGKLVHEQRSAREGFGLAWARTGNTDVRLREWTFVRAENGSYQARLPGRELSLNLRLTPTQPAMIQGEQGYSRKGPRAEQASYYYSEPHLKVEGTVSREGKPITVSGHAWLDHEWSSEVLDKQAAGWDWVGANLADGSALMAFRIRDKSGQQLWAHAAIRQPDGQVRQAGPQQVRFTPVRTWRSVRTQASYPVETVLEIDDRKYRLIPLQDDQELDGRLSTGSVYWEGAVRLELDGKPVGQGYLELTGYVKPLKL